MCQYFTFSKSKKYIDILDDLVKFYNKTYHRCIKTTPDKVNNNNSSQIFLNLYGLKDSKKPFKFMFHVRLSKSKRQFEKGYTNNWTKEIFVIYQQVINQNPTYVIKDLNDEIILG